MRFELYQDGEQIDVWEWEAPTWLEYSIDHKKSVNNRLAYFGNEPVDEKSMCVLKSSPNVVRVTWVDGAPNDATYSMTATFIG